MYKIRDLTEVKMDTILEVKNLKKYFRTPKGMLHAVDNVSFKIKEGSVLGVVGESGCGKSTLGRTILHLLNSTGGEIIYKGENITNINKKRLKELRKDMQIIFQDPFSSLDPRMTVSETIAEPMIIYKMYSSHIERNKKVAELMDIVGLSDRYVNTYPHELDGGRRQRIGVARALSLDPSFIVCDEPVSALDVSIQAQILNLMQDLQKDRNLTYMFITHDLSVVKHISNEIIVMYLGQVVEHASTDELFQDQYHPYTKALLSAVPVPAVGIKRERILLKGEISSPINPIDGCRFSKRCSYANEVCFNKNVELKELSIGHFVACHRELWQVSNK